MRRTHTALAFLLIAAASACDNTPPVPAPAFDARTAQQLFERLDRLVAALEATTHASVPVGEASTRVAERTLVADANTDLLARLEALEHELSRTRDRTGIPASPIARRMTPPPMEPMAVQQCCTQLQGEDQAVRQEARRSLFQLTEQQVLQRFGTPTSTGIDNGHVRWTYEIAQSYFQLTFVDGRVVVIDA